MQRPAEMFAVPSTEDQRCPMSDDALRVDALRQKLEQYNAGIAKAMSDLASAGVTRLKPPALSGTASDRYFPAPAAQVERDLGAEFLAAEAARKSLSRPQPKPVVDEQPLSGQDDEDEEESDSEEVDVDEEFAEVPAPRMSPPAVPLDISSASKPKQRESSSSPSPQLPSYSFNELETAYHRVNAVHDCGKVFSAFHKASFQPLHQDRLRALLDTREQLLARDSDLRHERIAALEHRSTVSASESDFFAMVQDLVAECDAAKKGFSLVYERKAVLYAKEKQLEQLAQEMHKMQQMVQSRRNSIAAIEARVEQRRKALKRRDDAFQVALAAHASREEELRKKVERVEELNGKISSWVKILETRDAELSNKEQRLKAVQQQILRRRADLSQLRGRD